jgi:hypothetical protein
MPVPRTTAPATPSPMLAAWVSRASSWSFASMLWSLVEYVKPSRHVVRLPQRRELLDVQRQK